MLYILLRGVFWLRLLEESGKRALGGVGMDGGRWLEVVAEGEGDAVFVEGEVGVVEHVEHAEAAAYAEVDVLIGDAGSHAPEEVNAVERCVVAVKVVGHVDGAT